MAVIKLNKKMINRNLLRSTLSGEEFMTCETCMNRLDHVEVVIKDFDITLQDWIDECRSYHDSHCYVCKQIFEGVPKSEQIGKFLGFATANPQTNKITNE